MCRERILSRLGSGKAKTAQKRGRKRFIGLILKQFLETPWLAKVKKYNPSILSSDLDKCHFRTEGLIEHLYEFECMDAPKDEDLVELIRHVSRFMRKVRLRTLLDCLEDRDMHDLARERLHSCLSKVARYRESARFLCAEVKKTPLLGNIMIEQVRLSEQAFRTPPSTKAVQSVESILVRLSHQDKLFRVGDLPLWTRKEVLGGNGNHFSNEVKEKLQMSKIHAEVQVLAHYENAGPGIIPPRIIASSKDACYLCNTLISLHGKFSVPKTHGKLYPGWRLPMTTEFGRLREKLNDYLEGEIAATIQRLGNLQNRPTHRFLNESTIFPMNISASTFTTLSNLSNLNLLSQVEVVQHLGQSPARIKQDHADTDSRQSQGVDGVSPCSSLASDACTGAELGSGSVLKDEADDGIGEERSCDDGVEHENKVTLSNQREGAEMALDMVDFGERGMLINTENEPLVSDEDNCENDPRASTRATPLEDRPPPFECMLGRKDWFRCKDLDIFVDSPGLPCLPQWLGSDEAAAMLRRAATSLVDIQSLPTGGDTSLLWKDPDGNAYFAVGGQVVVIHTHVT